MNDEAQMREQLSPETIEKMVEYLTNMRERKSYGGMVMANFFAHWHETILALVAAHQSAIEQTEAVLPYEVDVGGVKFGKGVKLQTLVNAAARWKKDAGEALFPGLATEKMKPLVEAAKGYLDCMKRKAAGFSQGYEIGKAHEEALENALATIEQGGE